MFKVGNRFFAALLLFLPQLLACNFGLEAFAQAPNDLNVNHRPNRSIYTDSATAGGDAQKSDSRSSNFVKHSSKSGSIAALEARMLELVNADRAKAGLSVLPLDPQLSAFARDYAEQMVKYDFFSHVDPRGRAAQQRATEFGIARPVYENIGWQSGTDSPMKKVEDLQQSFMSEPPNERNHRFIILVPQHKSIGIGIARKDDELSLVQEFAD